MHSIANAAGWLGAGGSTGSTGSRDGQGIAETPPCPTPLCIHLPPPPSPGETLLGVGGVPHSWLWLCPWCCLTCKARGDKAPLRHRWWEEEEEGGGAEREAGGRELCRNAACAAFPWLGAAEGFHGKRRRGSMNISLGKQCGVLQRTSGWSPWRPLPCAGSRNCEIRRKTRERGR